MSTLRQDIASQFDANTIETIAAANDRLSVVFTNLYMGTTNREKRAEYRAIAGDHRRLAQAMRCLLIAGTGLEGEA